VAKAISGVFGRNPTPAIQNDSLEKDPAA